MYDKAIIQFAYSTGCTSQTYIIDYSTFYTNQAHLSVLSFCREWLVKLEIQQFVLCIKVRVIMLELYHDVFIYQDETISHPPKK